ncbi:MAG: HAD family hydrolase [Candidatus Sabulitectum sp.]|nr:HAD family hydrolase [Candidatus Sabulitectum sp.]
MNPLYISDLDGTLLRDNGTLSPFTRDALDELLQENLSFTVASARSVSSIKTIFAGLKLHLPVIEFNGAIISDLESGEHLFINSIDPPLVEDIYDVINARGCSPLVSTYTGSEDRLYYSSVTNDGISWYLKDRRTHNDKRLRFVDDIRTSFRDQVICLNVIGRIDVLSELELEFRERYQDSLEIHCLQDQYSPGFFWLTAHHKKATKDHAIQVLQKLTGFPDCEVVVFGDNSNDISMFKMAHRSIAVSNATEELKKYATEVIGSNNEDSVARYIQNDWCRQ